MKVSLKGHPLPENHEESQQIIAEKRALFTQCLLCLTGFSDDNVKTTLGWHETQITGFCETCFDKLFGKDVSDEIPQQNRR